MLSTKNRTPQWIELYNTTDREIELKGWKLVGWSLQGVDGDVQPVATQTLGSLTLKAKAAHVITVFPSFKPKD